ncbi:hypothetical protein [Shinella sp.]|uniref:DUF7168 domain-containing protein n=1 Tax=Shinella sp. TaxID=1870904 RepID=UPI002584C7F6|nr:hypothetical protein [Shinella sp.]MCW5711323.1 hypothetical protein [Shinella sp.]
MNRETIRKRVNILRERTTARGCTEAEAMEAAEKIAEMMREHGLSGDDLDMGEEAGLVKASDKRLRLPLWGLIAGCTNTAAITRTLLSGLQVVYVGREPGPEIAVYLLDVCNNAIDAELARFRRGDFYRSRRKASTRRKAALDFTAALVQRLCRRLDRMFEGNRNHADAQRAAQELDRRFPTAQSTKPARRHKVTYDSAAEAGWLAGGRVHLGHGVRGGSDKPLLIGRN